MNNYGDNYETHPFDIKYMLNRWAVRQSDVIWDPFVCSGHSQREIAKLGYQVYTGTEDVMQLEQAPEPVTLIVTNPPYSDKSAVLRKLASFKVPFVLLLPTIVIQRDYFTNVVRSCLRHWHVVLPNKSLAFHHGGEVQHLPAFKCIFLYSCPSANEQERLQLDKVENVTFELLSYDSVRKQGGYSSEITETE